MRVKNTMEVKKQRLVALEENEQFWLFDVLMGADIKDYPPDVKRFIDKLIMELR